MSNGGELDGGWRTEGSRLIRRGQTGPVVLPAGTSIVALKHACNAGQGQTGCHGLLFTLFHRPSARCGAKPEHGEAGQVGGRCE